MEFKMDDKVRIKIWGSNGVVLGVDKSDHFFPYLVMDEDSRIISWFKPKELELINDN